MKNLSENINMQFGIVADAHVMNVNLGLNSYDTLCLICEELNVDLSEVTDSDLNLHRLFLLILLSRQMKKPDIRFLFGLIETVKPIL